MTCLGAVNVSYLFPLSTPKCHARQSDYSLPSPRGTPPQLTAYDLYTYRPLASVPSTRGAACFCVDEARRLVFVANKKRLQVGVVLRDPGHRRTVPTNGANVQYRRTVPTYSTDVLTLSNVPYF